MKLFLLFCLCIYSLQAETELEKNCSTLVSDLIHHKEEMVKLNEKSSKEELKSIKEHAKSVQTKSEYILINCKDIHTQKIQYEKWSSFLLSSYKDGLRTEDRINYIELEQLMKPLFK